MQTGAGTRADRREGLADHRPAQAVLLALPPAGAPVASGCGDRNDIDQQSPGWGGALIAPPMADTGGPLLKTLRLAQSRLSLEAN